MKSYGVCTPQKMIFISFLLIYLTLGFLPKVAGFLHITGDEPHYLVMTQSVARDGDFNLENNYAIESHKEFYNAPLDRHYINLHGKNYSLHQFGLPILMAPVYKLLGYKGVFFWLVLISCLGLVAVYDICQHFSNPEAAFMSTFLVGLTVPSSIYLSSQLFTETVAFSLFAFLTLIVLKTDFTRSKLSFVMILGISIMLSLLHVKFAFLIFGACLFSFITSLQERSIRRAVLCWTIIGLATAIVTYTSIFFICDGYVLEALRKASHPAGDEHAPSASLKYLARGIYLNFFEKEKGIFWYMPVLFIFLNPTSIYHFIRYRTAHCTVQLLGLCISTIPYLIVTFSFFDSLAGWCPPGRYLIPVMVFVAVMLSMVIDMVPKWLFKMSIFITVLCVLNPQMMYETPGSSWVPMAFMDTLSRLIISHKATNYATTVDRISQVRFLGLLIGSMFAAASYELIAAIFALTRKPASASTGGPRLSADVAR